MAKAASTAPAKKDGQVSNFPEVDLKDPVLAAILAWLVPGLGHWYQGRRAKAILFFVCILGTFFYGLYLGQGRVVYASLREHDWRLAYFGQVGVGVSAMPAMVQAMRFRDVDLRAEVQDRKKHDQLHFWDWFMVPPEVEDPNVQKRTDKPDELDELQEKLNRFFELGTVYTLIAGLLNVLAIYDAWGGPVYTEAPDESEGKDGSKSQKAEAAG